jgi:hypothetical protein
MMANKIVARSLASMRRSRRVSECTPIWPMPGRVTERARLVSPTRISDRRPMVRLLRSRNDGVAPVFFLKRGKPTRLPLRLPARESDQAANARPQSTAASSKTCWHTSARHGRPDTTNPATPLVSTATALPASSLFFPPLNALIRIKPCPRHIGAWGALAVGECGFHRARALIERKPGRPGMPGQHLPLLDRGV